MHTSLKELQVAAVQRMDTNCQRCSDTEEEPMAGTSKFAFFFLSGGRICENISNILHLKVLSRS